jgi:glycerol-3-phosphate cytidylyltransferase-like family protein
MVAPGSQWPPLSGGRENSATNINERILDANYDVRQLLNHISSNNSVKVPRPVLEYLKSIQELTTDLIKNPIGQDWKQQFEQLRQETSQIKQDIHAVRIASSNTTPNRIRSYVDAVKNAPPPTHFLSSYGSASTNPATPSDLL